MPLPDYFLQELKARCDITDVVSSYVNLKRRGKNMVGLCPFHNEKTPSFNIYPDNGSFYCFGCGTGGDVITFVMKIENLDYMEAVRFLAQRAGLDIPENTVDDSMSKLRARVREINRETARFYHSYMLSPEGKKGLDYFLSRGMSPKLIRHFGLGYSPESRYALVNHLRSLKYRDEEMIQANVAFKSRSGYTVDRFIGRAMFPIIDLTGNVVAFGGRALGDEKPKYINTSDTPVYKKSNGLFAMNFAKNAGGNQLILAEGYMDVISLHGAGFTNAIASLGTALTSEQARIIAKYAREVVICYDSDEAGQKAAQRAIPILRDAGLLVKVMAVPGNKDPDEFIRSGGKDGPAKFKALIDACGNDVEYRLAKLKQGFDTTTDEGRVRYLTSACDVLASVDNDIEREVYAGKLSQELGVDKSAILAQVRKVFSKNRRNQRQKQQREQNRELSAIGDRVNPEKARNLRIANAEEGVIAYLFQNPDAAAHVASRLPAEKFCTAFNRRVYEFILGKTKEGESVSMTDFSGSFSEAELSSVARILAFRNNASITRSDADQYIGIILSDSSFSDADRIRSADNSQLQEYLNMLKNRKK